MSPPGPVPADRWPDPWALYELLRRRRRVILLFLIGVMGAAVAASLFSARQYRAVALIHLLPRAGQEVAFNENLQYDPASYLEGRERARTQLEIIQSRSIREEVIHRYVGLGYDDYTVSNEDLDRFGRSLSAGPREDTQLVEIRVEHTDPERAATLANLVAEVYREHNLEARRDAARETKLWLEGRNVQYKERVENTSEALLSFRSAYDLIDEGEEIDGVGSRLATLQRTHSETGAERVLAESRAADYRRLAQKGEYDLLASMIEDPTLASLAQERATVVAKNAEVLARYGDQHPEHRRVQAHLQRVDEMLEAQLNRNVESERSKAAMLRRQEQRLEEELDIVKQELLAKQRLQDEFEVLRAENDRARKVYESLGERGTEVELQAHTQLNDVRIVDWAIPPTGPFKPNIPLNLALGLFVGLGGGLGLALFVHRLDDTLITVADVESELHGQVLGQVPSLEADGVGVGVAASIPVATARALHTWLHPRSFTAEAFRGIRTTLSARVDGARSVRIAVSSLLEGEGKTTTAVSLAVAWARLGVPVLLVDGDLRSPRIHTVFELPSSPGLTEALGAEDPTLYIRPSQLPGLSLLTAGSETDRESELVASEAMADLLKRLEPLFRVIIIDTPPSMLLSDAVSLAQRCDGMVMVMRSGRVRRQHVRSSLLRMHELGVRLLGVVLNDTPLPPDARRYGLDRLRVDGAGGQDGKR